MHTLLSIQSTFSLYWMGTHKL